ncbi:MULTISPECIES: FABP family protein [unclassified Kitasatospora]|uniref:FABP family protein n=1 Tax=unclassified Kitasatospora TaxID=2633591 RepID=UPI00070BA2EC|nr:MULTISPECIES: FABP family protein [unclassified Kitasatospora]KQV24218.1 fatty acid-binding protein [Kitasatospora sp. Root107]KRB67070.1 fatty acid-binding protein [Kitasatospora sp. Root187]
MIEIPSDLHKDVVPLAFLLGTWEGAGVFDFPGAEKCNFGQEIVFRHDSRPFLEFRSRSWVLNNEGEKVRPLETEHAFWRVTSNQHGTSGEREIEVSSVRDDGTVEIWYGKLHDGKPQIDLATDAVARIEGAAPYSGGKRLYGMVAEELLWVGEKAAPEVSLRPYMSAQLKKVLNPARLIQDIADLPDDGIAFFR